MLIITYAFVIFFIVSSDASNLLTKRSPVDTASLVTRMIRSLSNAETNRLSEVTAKFNEKQWFAKLGEIIEFMGNDLKKSRNFLKSDLFRDW